MNKNKIVHIEKECVGECPKCGSEDILWHTGQMLDETYIYDADCNKCGVAFQEEYTLEYNITIMEEEQDEKG